MLPEEDEEVLQEGGGAGVVGRPLEDTNRWKNPGNGTMIQVREREREIYSGVSGVLLLCARLDSLACCLPVTADFRAFMRNLVLLHSSSGSD